MNIEIQVEIQGWDERWNAILSGNDKPVSVAKVAEALPPDDGLAAQMVRLAEAGLAHDTVTDWAGEPEDVLPNINDFATIRSEAEVRYSLALHAAWRELEHWVMTTAQMMDLDPDAAESVPEQQVDLLRMIPLPALRACQAYLAEQHAAIPPAPTVNEV